MLSRGAIALVAKINAAAGEIVRRHFHDHPVADAGADAELAHLPRHIGEDLVLIVERDAVIAVREDLGHRAVELEQLFFGHMFVSNSIAVTAAHAGWHAGRDRKSTRLNSSHWRISYAVFFLKKKLRAARKTHGAATIAESGARLLYCGLD